LNQSHPTLAKRGGPTSFPATSAGQPSVACERTRRNSAGPRAGGAWQLSARASAVANDPAPKKYLAPFANLPHNSAHHVNRNENQPGPTVVLFGPTACENEARLRRRLRRDWTIVTLRDEQDVSGLREALGKADALIALSWRAEWKDAARRLRLIQATGAGVDAYEVRALPAGCALCNVYEHATPIAEYVMGAMVALTGRWLRRDRLLRQGIWDGTARREGEPHEELAGRTLGLLGYGTIGREVARRAAAFDLKTVAVRAHASAASPAPPLTWLGGPNRLRELLSVSDYLVICCPLTPQTRGLLDAEKLSWLKPGAYLVNVARAEIVQEPALFDALKSGQLAGAALDVWYRYPLGSDDRLLPAHAPFHELDNVLMTPHLSAWTHALIERRWTKIAANLDALAAGRPLQNVVAQN
jgi:phosphoglycerate dehydrogenase-like enzyme